MSFMRSPRPSPARAVPALLAAALWLGACSTVPMPALSPQLPEHYQHAMAQGAVPTDLTGWWHDFHDPQLDALVNQALADNLGLAQARERVLAARELYARVDARYEPQLHAHTDNAIAPNARASYLLASFDASWEFGLFGRKQANRRLLQSQVDEGTAQLQGARVSLVGEVVSTWLQLCAGQEQAALQGRIRDALARQGELVAVRASLGLASPLQRAEAQAAVARASSALIEIQQGVEASAQQLALLLGRAQPDPAWVSGQRLAQLGDWSLTQAPANLVRTRPEIAAAEAAVLRAAGESGLAEAERLPNLSIAGSVVWSGQINENRPTNTYWISTVGPVIDIPLVTWGLRRAQARARAHELTASVYAYREAVLQGVAEVENALGNLQRQREREQLLATAVTAAEQAAASLGTRRELALASSLEEQSAAVSVAEAQIALLQVRAARDIAFVALFKALGGAPAPQMDGAAERGS